MVELTSTNISIRVRASVLALLFYREQFDEDMTAEAFKFAANCEQVNPELPASELRELMSAIEEQAIKIIWAMHKAQGEAENVIIPDFRLWLEAYGKMDAVDITHDLLMEIYRGFYCPPEAKKPKGKEKSPQQSYSDYVIIIGCKNMGFSLDEMNKLTVKSYAGLVDVYMGNAAHNGERLGTQADIDRFF